MSTPAGVAYRLAIPAPHTHLLEVEVRASCPAGPCRLVMPSWTPGSYLLREFPRHVQSFQAEDADRRTLAHTKLDKNTWQIDVATAGTVHVQYTVYANELTVRTSHVDATHAYINGASVWMWVDGAARLPCTLEIDVPDGWQISTSLRAAGHRFQAESYDALVDAPLEIGTHEVLPFQVHGVPHRYAVWGRGNLQPERLVADTQAIVAAAARFWGGLPYREYLFLLHLLPGAHGGLEHGDGCSLHADRWAFHGRDYENFLALVAHEHFHAWNGKRLVPAALARPDYTRENYTRDLWVVEGITTYYTDRILLAAGIISPERYLERTGELITRVESTPGRRLQSLADSSWDTWIRFYRPDENTPNSQISYYQKGALVALLLDLRIRKLTGGRRSLDDVMRQMWEQWGCVGVGYPEGALEGVARDTACDGVQDLLDVGLRTTADLDLAGELAGAGLMLAPNAHEPPPGAQPAWATRLGVRVRKEGPHARVTHVLTDTPAHRAGVNAGDELVAADGFRIAPAALDARVTARPPGDQVRLSLFRREELLTLDVQLATPEIHGVRVELLRDCDSATEALRRGWLHLDPAPAAG